MDTHAFGLNRAARRKGSNPQFSGGSNADTHLQDLAGINGLWIYLTASKTLKGYRTLQDLVEANGCSIGLAVDAPVNAGKGYKQLKIGAPPGRLLPFQVVREAHRWAHRHNFLHSFYKPDIRKGFPDS